MALNYVPLCWDRFHDISDPLAGTELFPLNKGRAEAVQGLNVPLLQGA